MAVRLRLRRMGKKKQPFYRIVAIDSRVSRNGEYLENIGYYNPLPNPIDLNVKAERALYWLQNGAQPSDTVKSLLRKKGVMLRFDLLKKGKSEEEINQEVQKWQLFQEERMKKYEAAKAQESRQKEEDVKKAEKAEESKKEEPIEEDTAAETADKPETKEQEVVNTEEG